jgi:hypothetical protein
VTRRRSAVVLACALVALAGCGSDPADPGDERAQQVLAYAAHGRALVDRTGAVGRALVTHQATVRDTQLALSELLGESALLEEDVAANVPLGARGRVPTLEGARELTRAAAYLRSYATGHPPGLALARAHLGAAARALAGASRALEPRLTEVQKPQLDHLRAAVPALR